MISKAESNVLKAISIIVIVLNHFWAWIYKPKDIVLMLSVFAKLLWVCSYSCLVMELCVLISKME